jgi:hypothetical protein
VAINLRHETLLSLTEAAARIGRHRETVRGYIARGLLDGVRIAGGPWQTSIEALERASLLVNVNGVGPLPLTPAQVARAHREAEEELVALGIRRRRK